MKILVLSHDLPSPVYSDTLPVFHILRNLTQQHGHQITLVTFRSERMNENDIATISEFCAVGGVFPAERRVSTFRKALEFMKNIAIHNLLTKFESGLTVTDYYFSTSMARRIGELLRDDYDLVYMTWPMGGYVRHSNLPKALHLFDALDEWNAQVSKSQRGIQKYTYLAIRLLYERFERGIAEFDVCFIPTRRDRSLVGRWCPSADIRVVPLGVDTESFKPYEMPDDGPSLIFVSDMSAIPTSVNVTFFYTKVYPTIRKAVPGVKLYLVGRDPAPVIAMLAADPSVVVTGYVESVIPYLAKARVFVAPMIVGTGMKNKVLEAMAMGKCIVTTDEGVQGLEVVPGKHLIIADNPNSFADSVITLLQDEERRQYLGTNARALVEEKYSWRTVTSLMNGIIEEVKSRNHRN